MMLYDIVGYGLCFCLTTRILWFGDGYTVKVWLHKEGGQPGAVSDCLKLHFPGIQFKGQHLNLLEYHVQKSWECLADLFKVLEDKKSILNIKHYSISQTTLEQGFFSAFELLSFLKFMLQGFPYQQVEISCMDAAGWQEEGVKPTKVFACSPFHRAGPASYLSVHTGSCLFLCFQQPPAYFPPAAELWPSPSPPRQ
ncbi:hypothetical protein STEG23_002147 [Scotinomys teguina]